jgi:hypothetical protein
VPTYFGYNASGVGDDSGDGGSLFWHNPAVFVYTCPGSGNQTIKELSAYVHYGSVSTYHIAVAAYSAAGALLCKSPSTVVDNPAYAWKGVTDPAQTSPANYNLTGGVQYCLAALIENNDTHFGYDTATGNNVEAASSAYGSGPPATLPSGTPGTEKYCIRCGVDPASGAFAPILSRLGQPFCARTFAGF